MPLTNNLEAEGKQLIEGGHINQSLLILGQVISKLAEKTPGHIPYRDSKLTRILQSSLGGNARTLIICTITPASIHREQTRGTLQFANRAKQVKNQAVVNEVMDDQTLLRVYKKKVADLQYVLLRKILEFF